VVGDSGGLFEKKIFFASPGNCRGEGRDIFPAAIFQAFGFASLARGRNPLVRVDDRSRKFLELNWSMRF